jgi:hypothetical protein
MVKQYMNTHMIMLFDDTASDPMQKRRSLDALKQEDG